MTRSCGFDSRPCDVAEVKLDAAPGCEPGEVGSRPTGHLWGVIVTGNDPVF